MQLHEFLTPAEKKALDNYHDYIAEFNSANNNKDEHAATRIGTNSYSYRIVDGTEEVILVDGMAHLKDAMSNGSSTQSCSITELYRIAAQRIQIKFPSDDPKNSKVNQAVREMLEFANAIARRCAQKIERLAAKAEGSVQGGPRTNGKEAEPGK